MCYFFKKIKNVLQFTFEKKITCAKREKKITCPEEKSQPLALDIKWSVPKRFSSESHKVTCLKGHYIYKCMLCL